MKRVIKQFTNHVLGIIGILYSIFVHLRNPGSLLVFSPNGIGEIIQIGSFLPKLYEKTSGKMKIVIPQNRKSTIEFIDYQDYRFILGRDFLMNSITSLIFTRWGNKYIRNQKWLLFPGKTYEETIWEKGFIWNIKDGMGLRNDEINQRKPQYNNLNLQSKREIIYINPYARSINGINDEFYIRLVNNLKKNSFVVKTILGDSNQKAIEGTEGVHCSLKEACSLLAGSLGVIGLRSGFMDLIAGLDTTIICLYPLHNKFNDYFSFSYLEFENSITEIYMSDYDEIDIIEKITDHFGNSLLQLKNE